MRFFLPKIKQASSHWINDSRYRTKSHVLALTLAMLAAGSLPAQSLSLLVEQALARNQGLQGADADYRAALENLAAARSERLPKLAWTARALRSEGGRVIELPVGDALNPVYQTLNQLTATSANPTRFQAIENPSFDTLREREIDTRLTLNAPLYAPALDAQIELQQAQALGANALRELLARTLVRDVQIAYFNLGRARAAADTLAASERVLTENVRVNEKLLAAGTVTRDKLLRAQAELLAVQDRRQSTRDQAQAALRYLNFLRAMPLDSALEGELEAQFPWPETPQSGLAQSALEPSASHAQTGDTLYSANDPAIRAADARLAVSRAGERLARSQFLPTVGLGVEAGTQAEDLAFGSGRNVAIAAVQFNWTLFDFGARASKQRAAAALIEKNQAEREQLKSQLELRIRDAREKLASAILRTQTSQLRLKAADETLRIAEKQRDAGSLSQIEFLDSERARTEAAVAELSARFEQAIASAELQYARANFPLAVRSDSSFPSPNTAKIGQEGF